jgi:hypothetical protein
MGTSLRKEMWRGPFGRGVDPLHHREMDNPSGPEKRRAYQKLWRLAYLRSEGSYTEEQIAERLEFGSPEAMYIQLREKAPGAAVGTARIATLLVRVEDGHPHLHVKR